MAEQKAFVIRLDPPTLDGLQAWAAQERRSVNAQIEYVLKDALARRRRSASSSAGSGSR